MASFAFTTTGAEHDERPGCAAASAGHAPEPRGHRPARASPCVLSHPRSSSWLIENTLVGSQIEASPELRSMGPQVRQIMQSDHFRNLITNPDAMRQMHQLQQMMGAGGGGGGMGGASPFGGLGANPFGGAGAQAGAAPGTGGEQGQQAGARSPPPNPFAMFGGGGAGAGGANAGAGAGGMPDFGQLMAALGGVGGGGLGSFGGFGGAPQQPQQPPEERFQVRETLASAWLCSSADAVLSVDTEPAHATARDGALTGPCRRLLLTARSSVHRASTTGSRTSVRCLHAAATSRPPSLGCSSNRLSNRSM